jgi:hypothetical protein
MSSSSRAAARFTSDFAFDTYGVTTALMRIASSRRAKVRTDKLQPVIDAALLVAERGRGP